jgi:hypothetical protein
MEREGNGRNRSVGCLDEPTGLVVFGERLPKPSRYLNTGRKSRGCGNSSVVSRRQNGAMWNC